MFKCRKIIIAILFTLIISNVGNIKKSLTNDVDQSDVVNDEDIIDGENGFGILNSTTQNSDDDLISYDYISQISGAYDPIALSSHNKVYFSGINSHTKSGSGTSGSIFQFTNYSNWDRTDGSVAIKAVGSESTSLVLYDNGVVMAAGSWITGLGGTVTSATELTTGADNIWMTFGDAGFIKKGDQIFGVGKGDNGRVIIGHTGNITTLTNISTQFTDVGIKVEDIVDIQGQNSTIVQLKDGTLWGFGNTDGVLGSASSTTASGMTNLSNKLTYTGSTIKKFVANTSTMILYEDGTMFGAGANTFGLLGFGNTSTVHQNYRELTTPVLEEGDKIVDIYASPVESYILTKYGRIFAAGGNIPFNATCIDQSDYIKVFTEVTSYFPEWGRNIKMISPVLNRTIFLTHEGYLFGCGVNNTGRLATGHPSYIVHIGTVKPLSVAFHTATVTANSLNFSFNILSEGYYTPTSRFLRIKDVASGTIVSTQTYTATDENIDHVINHTSGIKPDTEYEVYVDDSSNYRFVGGIRFKTEKATPSAVISNIDALFNKITVDITLTDTYSAIDTSKSEPRVELVDAYGIVRGTKDILNGINTVEFIDLKLNNGYTMRIYATYDTGKGLVEDSLLESMDIRTSNKVTPSVTIDSLIINQTTINGDLSIVDSDLSIISMQLFIIDSNGNNVPGKTITYKEQLNGSMIIDYKFIDVVVGQGYFLIVEITYNIDGNLVIGEEQDRNVFSILETDKPLAELEIKSVNINELEIELRLVDIDLAISNQESTFIQLFEIWDINGVDTEVETYLIMNVDTTKLQPDFTTPGEVYTIPGLSPNMKYKAKIFSTYDIGYGLTRNDLLYTSTNFETTYYTTPKISINNIVANKETLSFDVDVEDVDNIINTGKVTVTDQSNIALEETVKLGTTSYNVLNLDSNKNYYIMVEITYDRGDGLETATEIKDATTLLKQEHTLDIIETDILWNEFEIELDIVDDDNVIKDDGITIRVSYSSPTGEVEVATITKDPTDPLSGIRFYLLEPNIEYLVDIIIEYDTGLELEEIKEYSKLVRTIRKVESSGNIDVVSTTSVGVQSIEFDVTIDDIDSSITMDALEYKHVEIAIYDEIGDEVLAKRVVLSLGNGTCIGTQCIFSGILIDDLVADEEYTLELEIIEDIGDGERLEVKDVKKGKTGVRIEEQVTIIGLSENIIAGNGLIELQFEVEDLGDAIISDVDVTITEKNEDESRVTSFTILNPTEIFSITFDTDYETSLGNTITFKPGREYEVKISYTKDIYDDGIGQLEEVTQSINLREKSQPITSIQVTNIGVTTVEFETRIIDTDSSILSQLLVLITYNNERTEVSVPLGVVSHQLENYVNMQAKEKYKIIIEVEYDRGREVAVGDFNETLITETEVETLEKDKPEGSITSVNMDYETKSIDIEGEVFDVGDAISRDTKINVIVKDVNNVLLFEEFVDGKIINFTKIADFIPNVEYRVYIEATYNTGDGEVTADIYKEFGNPENYFRYVSPRKLPVDAEFLSIDVNVNVIEFEVSIIDQQHALISKPYIEIMDVDNNTLEEVIEVEVGQSTIEVSMKPNRVYEIKLFGVYNVGDGDVTSVLKRLVDGKDAYELLKTDMFQLPSAELDVIEIKYNFVNVGIEIIEVGKGLIQERRIYLSDLSGKVIEEYDLSQNHLGEIKFTNVAINTNYIVQISIVVDIGEGTREYVLQSEETRVGQKESIRFTSQRQSIAQENASFKWEKDDIDDSILRVGVTLEEVVGDADTPNVIIYDEDITNDVLSAVEGEILFTGLDLGMNYIIRYSIQYELGDNVERDFPVNSIEFRTSYRLAPVSQIKVHAVEWNLIEIEVVINDIDIAILGDIVLTLYDGNGDVLEERVIDGSGEQIFKDLDELNIYQIDLYYEYEIGDGDDYYKRDVVGLKTQLDIIGLIGKISLGAGSLLVSYVIYKKFKKIDTAL